MVSNTSSPLPYAVVTLPPLPTTVPKQNTSPSLRLAPLMEGESRTALSSKAELLALCLACKLSEQRFFIIIRTILLCTDGLDDIVFWLVCLQVPLLKTLG